MTPAEEARWDRAIEAGNVEADRIVGDMCDDIPDEIWGETVFALWIALTHILADLGWSAAELQREVATHEALETTQGPIQ